MEKPNWWICFGTWGISIILSPITCKLHCKTCSVYENVLFNTDDITDKDPTPFIFRINALFIYVISRIVDYW